jgi:hypothetical protein
MAWRRADVLMPHPHWQAQAMARERERLLGQAAEERARLEQELQRSVNAATAVAAAIIRRSLLTSALSSLSRCAAESARSLSTSAGACKRTPWWAGRRARRGE